MGYPLNRLDEPILIAVSKPLHTEFGIHHRLESCAYLNYVLSRSTRQVSHFCHRFGLVKALRTDLIVPAASDTTPRPNFSLVQNTTIATQQPHIETHKLYCFMGRRLPPRLFVEGVIQLVLCQPFSQLVHISFHVHNRSGH